MKFKNKTIKIIFLTHRETEIKFNCLFKDIFSANTNVFWFPLLRL